jgi:hypothetical protein
MKFRTLRIAWSVVWGLAAILFCALWFRTVRFQDSGGVWITSSYYGHATAFKHWLKVDIAKPQQPGNFRTYSYQHNFVEDPIPNIVPVHRWHFGASRPPYSPGVSTSLQIWIPVVLCTSVAVIPWLSQLTRTKQFSVRDLLIVTALVAVVLGVIAWAVR